VGYSCISGGPKEAQPKVKIVKDEKRKEGTAQHKVKSEETK